MPALAWYFDLTTGRRMVRDRETGLAVWANPMCEPCGRNHSGPPCSSAPWWSNPALYGNAPDSDWMRTRRN